MSAYRRLGCGCQQGVTLWLCVAHRAAAWGLALAEDERRTAGGRKQETRNEVGREIALRHLSPTKVAAEVGVSQSTLWEFMRHGVASARTLALVAAWLETQRLSRAAVESAAPPAGAREEGTDG